MSAFISTPSSHYRPSPSSSVHSGVYRVSAPSPLYQHYRTPSKPLSSSVIPGKYVGIADLPNQVYRRVIKEGFKLNLMVLGEPGVGKSAFINSLFGIDLYDGSNLLPPSERRSNTLEVERHVFQMEAKGVRILVSILDCPAFGNLVDNSSASQVVEQYIDEQFRDYFESSHKRSKGSRVDKRVHCCLYVIPPTGHSLRPLDIATMKNLGVRTNLIPVIGRADSLTREERDSFKEIVRKQLKEHDVQVYYFPSNEEDPVEGAEIRTDEDMVNLVPFAVVGSNTVIPGKDGSKIRVRKYPWGILDVNDPKISDLSLLRRLLLFDHFPDVVDITDGLHYSNYIRDFLGKHGSLNSRYVMGPGSLMAGSGMFSSPQTGKSDADACVVKLERELQVIFDQKVKEKMQRLDDSGRDLEVKYKEWEEQLAIRRKKLRLDREAFENQKVVLLQAYPQLQERLAQELVRAGIRI